MFTFFIQSGASSRAKHGGAYFLAVTGLALCENQECCLALFPAAWSRFSTGNEHRAIDDFRITSSLLTFAGCLHGVNTLSPMLAGTQEIAGF